MTLYLWIMVGFIVAKLLLLIPLFMSIRDSYRSTKECETTMQKWREEDLDRQKV